MHAEIDHVLADSVGCGDLVGVTAAVSTPKVAYTGAAGRATEGSPMTPDTPVWIASMTKAVTAVAALQLVEQGRVGLDAPCGELIPFLGDLQVLEGFAQDGRAILRRAARPVTLRQLLTHTSGFGYEFTDARLARHLAEKDAMGRAAYEQPLLFDPGERWTYGIGVDWAGQVVEAVTGQRLDRYLRDAVLDPLAMHDTGFRFDGEPYPPAADMYIRTPDGLVPTPFAVHEDPKFVKGGSGLYGTVVDYLRFLRMILGGGALDGVRVLAADTVRLMAANHIGELSVTGWQTANPASSNDVDFYPGMRQEWGLSFLVNTETTPEGRSPGSLAWAGLANTYFWIDPARQVAGAFATQVLPFFDGPALETFRSVERTVYASL